MARTHKPKTERLILVNFKVLPKDLKKMLKNAKKFTEGNLSELLREGSLNFRPKRSTNR